MQNDNLKNQLKLHFIVFIWGFTAILGALISLDAMPLVWMRVMFASLFVLLFILYKRKSLKVSLKALGGFALAGIILALHWLAFFYSIKISTISITLACISTGAFFTALLEPLFYKRKIIAYELILGVLVVVALAVIFSFEFQHVLGIAVGLLAAVLSALVSVINGKIGQKYDAAVAGFYEIFIGFLMLSVVAFFSWETFSLQLTLTSQDWIYLLVLSSICTAYPIAATINLMKYLSPYTVMLTINMEPIYGILMALLIFKEKEHMTPAFYFGALLILLTVIANAYFKNKTKRRFKKE